MHPSELLKNQAIGVTTEGVIEVRPNDIVMVGVKCWIDVDGNAVPFNDKLQSLRKELNSELGNDVYIFKRLNPESNVNTERNQPVNSGTSGVAAG